MKTFPLAWAFVWLLPFIGNSGLAQSAPTNSKKKWLTAFLTAGADGSSFRHFIILSDSTVASFAAGGPLEKVDGIDHVVALAAGAFHILALKKDGTIWSWGKNDEYQLGNRELTDNNTAITTTPVQVTGITQAVDIAAGYATSYALLADGTVWAWGNGNLGGTGDGKEITMPWTSAEYSARRTPVQVKNITTAIAVSDAAALLKDGSVVTWGKGVNGRLGNGGVAHSAIPVKVNGIRTAVALSTYGDGGMVLLADGTVWSWGSNFKGQLGNGGKTNQQNSSYSNIPVQVKGITNAIAIDANSVSIALLKDGTVKAWGWDELGGTGVKDKPSNLPATVPVKPTAIAIATGRGYGFALLHDGTLMGWGANMVATGIHHQTYKPVIITQLKLR